jgi:hypothetical protein
MLTFQIAFRNILRQKRRSLLTGLSMTGGYMLFVLGYSILEGSYGNAIDMFTPMPGTERHLHGSSGSTLISSLRSPACFRKSPKGPIFQAYPTLMDTMKQ